MKRSTVNIALATMFLLLSQQVMAMLMPALTSKHDSEHHQDQASESVLAPSPARNHHDHAAHDHGEFVEDDHHVQPTQFETRLNSPEEHCHDQFQAQGTVCMGSDCPPDHDHCCSTVVITATNFSLTVLKDGVVFGLQRIHQPFNLSKASYRPPIIA